MSVPKPISVKFESIKLVIPSVARYAYVAWVEACLISERHGMGKLITSEALKDAIRFSPLPVVRMGEESRPKTYGVLGRFNLYYQVKLLRPDRVTLIDLGASTGHWSQLRLQKLSQAMHLMDIGARGLPLRELSSVLADTRRRGWKALRKQTPSRRYLAQEIGTTEEKLKDPRISEKEESFRRNAQKILFPEEDLPENHT